MWTEEDPIVLFVVGAIAVSFILIVADIVQQVLARRQRYARYHDLNTEPQRLTRPVDLGESISADRSESIRLDAENAARLAYMIPGYKAVNPHEKGTVESILWFATFNLVATQLADTVDIDLSEPSEVPAISATVSADVYFWTYTSTQPEA